MLQKTTYKKCWLKPESYPYPGGPVSFVLVNLAQIGRGFPLPGHPISLSKLGFTTVYRRPGFARTQYNRRVLLHSSNPVSFDWQFGLKRENPSDPEGPLACDGVCRSHPFGPVPFALVAQVHRVLPFLVPGGVLKKIGNENEVNTKPSNTKSKHHVLKCRKGHNTIKGKTNREDEERPGRRADRLRRRSRRPSSASITAR